MQVNNHKIQFINSIKAAIESNLFIKLSLGNYKGNEAGLKNIYAKQVLIKHEPKLSFTYRYQTKDITKNYTPDEAIKLVDEMIGQEGFKVVTLFATKFDLSIEYFDNGKVRIKEMPATHTEAPSLMHDRQKNHALGTNGKSYLTELGITNADGKVYKSAQDKYKQINHYIEILSSLLKEVPVHNVLKVVDMGAGKGYLTFALYDYLTNILKIKAEITGVEMRADLVQQCNDIAQKAGFDGLHFVQGTIQDYDSNGLKVLIALHACDTATDDAIAKGINANADLIVVAPCCHKQIRREIEKHKQHSDLDYLLRYGIFMERQAEMVTDGIRALVLEYFGYSVKVVDFIADAHTPKNVMLIGVKKHKAFRNENTLNKIKEAKAYFGIRQHHLEALMGLH